MLRELEDLFAKWGAGFWIVCAVLSIFYIFTDVLYGIIYREYILMIFISGGVLFVASFTIFRADSKGIERRIHYFANANISTKYKKILIGTAWAIFISLPFGVLGLKVAGIADGTNFYDFGAYYNTAERVVHNYPLYDWNTPYSGVTPLPNSPDRYLYAPLISLLFVPFVGLPFEMAALAWSAVSVIVYLAGIHILFKTLTGSVSLRTRAIIYTASLGFGPFVVTFISGQVTGILAGILCFVGAGYYRQEGESIVSGALITIPAMFKVYYAPAGAPLLRDRRRLLSALITGTSIILGGVLIFDFQTTIEYLKVLAGGKGWGSTIDPPITWNINDFYPFYYLNNIGYLIRGLLLATIATVAYQSRNYEFEYIDFYVYSFGLLGVVLGVPVFATSGLTVTVPVILFLLVTTVHNRPGVFVGTLIAAILIHIHPYTNEFLSSILLPTLGAETFASLILPVAQSAVWGVFLLLSCVTYEYTLRLTGSSD